MAPSKETDLFSKSVNRDATAYVALPLDQGREEAVISGSTPMQGARLANITPALADEMQMDMMAKGVVVSLSRGACRRRASAFGGNPATSCAQ